MTGIAYLNAKKWPVSMALIAAMGLVACDENGEFGFPSSSSGAQSTAPLPANALDQRVQAGVDIERPDIFEVTDRGLWDGRPSLGGVWVAHPDVVDPDRVVIRNSDTGRSIVGALFRRERENPGPLLQVSSDAAEALGMLAGSPTQLNVVVLRRDETEIEDSADTALNPVVAELQTPISIEAEPLDPVATDAAAAVVVLPPALEAATSAVAQTAGATASATSEVVDVVTDASVDAGEPTEAIDVSAVLAAPASSPPAPEPLPIGSTAQIGVYSVEANAGADAQRVIASGIQAAVLPEELGGRVVWRVIAGPLADTGAITQLRELGFVDAFVIEDPEDEIATDE